MRTIIVGAGRIGMHLIGYLSSSDENQLTVIEKKGERCKDIADKYDAIILNEDGSKLDILKKADASQADLLLVATDDDRANLATTRAAKKEFGIPRVIGADVVICPVELALRDFENVLSKDHSITLMYRSAENLRVAEAIIPLNASLIGKKIHEIQLPEKCRVGLVCRENGFVFPEPELELKSGDKVLLLGDAPSVARTVELLRSSESA
jgi:trk system potassium uptake protein TrkA